MRGSNAAIQIKIHRQFGLSRICFLHRSLRLVFQCMDPRAGNVSAQYKIAVKTMIKKHSGLNKKNAYSVLNDSTHLYGVDA